MGTLFVVATPIGNLEDMTPRAVRTLREATLIAAEDTRHTGRLLTHFGVETPMLSYHAFNARSRHERLLTALEEADVALVTDAGTPGISDPGVALIDAALEAGFAVRTVPGPSSLTSAVSVSGLIEGPFTFLGFLPRKAGERRGLLARAATSGFGLVLFESPHRVKPTLDELMGTLAGRRYAVIRELSKLHEEVVRGRFEPESAGLERFADARGEIVIVVEGQDPTVESVDAEEAIRSRIAAGLKPNEAAKEVAAITGRPKSELYELAVRLAKAQLD